MPADTASEKKIGRPRDERARRCVLDAVRELLRHGGLCGMTMEGIARQAGVGKQTLYRWWPSLADVTLEALVEEAGAADALPATGEVREDLRAFLRQTFRMVGQHTGPLLRCLTVEAQKNEAFRERFLAGFVRARQEGLARLLAKGAGPGRMAPDLAAELVFGTLWYRLLVSRAPLDDALADQLVAALLGER